MRRPELPGVHPLLHQARQVLAAHLAGRDWRHAVPAERTRPSRGCFVSLKLAGRLRGCIGTVLPARPSLEEEVAENAVAAATRDPRFAPLRSAELSFVRLSLDLLTAPEPVQSVDELDAHRYGVLLRHERRLGVLLPDIPGVTSPEQQITICLEKAGLAPGSPYVLERFEVERHSE
ncbi:MAG TPA: AmmeMemoRadiSam system protein A [bacterium]|nr:AmmeMemoRadiSam system protein A [bacterium]